MFRLHHLLLCVIIMIFGSQLVTEAQITGTSATPLLNTGHDYLNDLNEIVDPSSGSLSIRIATPAPNERGVNIPRYAFSYSTSGLTNFTPSYTTQTSGYQAFNKVFLSQVQNSLSIPNTFGFRSETQSVGVGSNEVTCNYQDEYEYVDPDGGRHNLDLRYVTSELSNCGRIGISDTLQGGDEFYKATLVTNPTSSFLYIADSHGTVFTLPEDTNGNNFDGSGRNYSIQFGQSGQPTVGLPISVTIPGLAKPYQISYETVSRNQQFQFTGTCGNEVVTNNTPSTEPHTVTLPNGQQYTFGYDSTYGFVNSITYPAGSTVSYTWSLIPQSQPITFSAGANSDFCPFIYDWMGITKRIVSYDGVNPALEQDFSYTTTWPSGGSGWWTQKTTTITTTDLLRPGKPSFKTVYTYLPGSPSSVEPGTDDVLIEPIALENTISYYDTTGALLKTVTKSWLTSSLLSGECTTLPNNQTTGVFYQYEPGGQLNGRTMTNEAQWTDQKTDVAEYDYGLVSSNCQKPTTTPTRETVTTYQSFATTPIFPGGPSILDRPSSVRVYGNGAEISETDYGYDQTATTGVSGGALVANTHDDTNYGAGSSSPRGNTTTVTQKCIQGCSANLVTTYVYDETGQIASAKDANGNLTTYSYADNYSSDDGSPSGNTNTYLTTVTRPSTNGISHVESFSYGFEDGKMRSSTDENKQTTRYCYFTGGCSGSTMDPWARLTETAYPDGGSTTQSYSDAGPNPYTTTSTALSSSTAITTKTILDAYGHTIQTQTTSDPSGTDYVDTTYDGLGHVYIISNPYRSTSDPTYGTTAYSYDSLGRKTTQTQADNTTSNPSILQWCYDDIASSGQNNCLGNLSSKSSGSWVDYSDETGRHWQRISDGLGRLVAVMEPDGGSNNTAAPVLETDYTYNANNNLLKAAQSNAVIRTFSYDSLSRLVCAANPEVHAATCPATPPSSYVSGTVAYAYDGNGNVTTKIAPAPNAPANSTATVTTTYMYDALNRLTSKAYSDGTTPAAHFNYDEASVTVGPSNNFWSGPHPISNGIGRMTSWYVSSSEPGLAMKTFSYDPMGRPQQSWQCWGNECNTTYGTRQNSRIYDLAGNVVQLQNSADAAISYTYDNAGRMQTAAYHFQNGGPAVDYPLVASETYNASGQPLTRNGNESWGYDKRLRVSSYTNKSSPNSSTVNYGYALTYFPNSSVQTAAETSGSKSWIWIYNYDSLNRLWTVKNDQLMEGCVEQYDHYGNRNIEEPYYGTNYACGSFSQTVTGNNNHIDGYCFDAAGNILDQGPCGAGNTHTYSYDAEGRLATAMNGSIVNTYGADGIRTTTQVSGAQNNFVYDYDGSIIAHYAGVNFLEQDIWINGKHFGFVTPNANPANYSLTLSSTDWVGTERIRTDAANNLLATFCSLPFGDGATNCFGSDPDALDTTHFTGKERDPNTNLDYFGARYYSSSMGRWMSPDYSMNSVILELPQSWNKYNYELNRPTYGTDPDGRCPWCVGAIVGGVVEGGFDLGKQLYNNGGSLSKVSWGEVGASTVGGAVAGALAVATGGASLVESAVVGDIAAGGTANIVGGVVTRALDPNTKSDDVLSAGEVSKDAVAGFVGGGVGHLAGDVIHVPDEPIHNGRASTGAIRRDNAKFSNYNNALANQITRATVAGSAATHTTNGGFDVFNWLFFSQPTQPQQQPCARTSATDSQGNSTGWSPCQ
jgi:RHS repeat-associated protein